MPRIWPFRICGQDSKKMPREKKTWTLKVGMTNPSSWENKARPRDENYEKQWKMFISYGESSTSIFFLTKSSRLYLRLREEYVGVLMLPCMLYFHVVLHIIEMINKF